MDGLRHHQLLHGGTEGLGSHLGPGVGQLTMRLARRSSQGRQLQFSMGVVQSRAGMRAFSTSTWYCNRQGQRWGQVDKGEHQRAALAQQPSHS